MLAGMRTAREWLWAAGLGAVLLAASCQSREQPPVYYPPPPGAGYGGQPAYAPAPGAYPPPAPGAPAIPQPVPGPQPTLPPVAQDPINLVDLNFLRGRAQAVLVELVGNLPPAQQGRVRGIPLVVDSEVGEVNAYAACTQSGKTAMAISDGLLDVESHLAQARALDELFGSRKVDEYVRYLATNQRPKSPVVRPPPGMFDPAQSVDARKVARQHQLLDEQIAFVLGHELAHHYLGHLPCTSTSVISAAEVGRVLSDAVPLFNQPNELAADMAGVNNVLTTGSRRTGYRLTEGGALLTMQFFSGIDQLTPGSIIFGFERSHPPPALRTPIIQQTAAAWRATGGQGLPILGF